MPVITIRGQLGSGALEIGRRLAHRIGGDYVDREIIEGVAERAGAPREEVQGKEQPPTTLAGRILEALAKGAAASPRSGDVWVPTWEAPLDDRRYLAALTEVIADLAKSPSIVIRGRGSQFILKDHPGAIHILVVGPLKNRLKRVMEFNQIDEASAVKEISRSDGSHREFIKRYFSADIEDPVNYDLVLNTGRLSYDDCVDIVLEAVERVKRSGKN